MCSCGTRCTAKRFPAYVLFFVGIVALITCTAVTIYCDINPLTPEVPDSNHSSSNVTEALEQWTAGMSHAFHGAYSFWSPSGSAEL